ncbi:MAG: RNA-binding protein [Prevotellaceae bacterium]|jgi:RNA recognition motif-containing protein|nr:RNA-binding protein [Prevotellaceae bacterium]
MKNIFVSNLSFELKSEDLQEAFEAYGDVVSAKIITDKFTGRSRGFGFVEMSNDNSADEAISALNGTDLSGKTISVAEARPREEHSRDDRPRRTVNNGRSGGNRGGDGYNRGGYNRNNRY